MKYLLFFLVVILAFSCTNKEAPSPFQCRWDRNADSIATDGFLPDTAYYINGNDTMVMIYDKYVKPPEPLSVNDSTMGIRKIGTDSVATPSRKMSHAKQYDSTARNVNIRTVNGTVYIGQ